jgi:hypothetical protein
MAQHEPGELLFRKAECRSDKHLCGDNHGNDRASDTRRQLVPPITIVNAPTAHAAQSADTENAKLLAHLNPGDASSGSPRIACD